MHLLFQRSRWLCIVAVLLRTLPAHAQVAQLEWSAPHSCPTRSYVEQRLQRIVSADLPPRSDVRVHGVVRRTKQKSYALELSINADDYRVERSLESASCKSVADAAAWFIAMALDPSLSNPSAVADVAPSDPPAAVDAPAAVAAARPEASSTPAVSVPQEQAVATRARERRDSTATAPAPATRWRRWWRSGIDAGVWSGGLPAPQASLGARAGFGIGALYSELHVDWMFARTRSLSDGAQVSFTTQQLGLASCPQWGGRVRAGPCATLHVLRSEGSATNTDDAGKRALFWASAGVSVQLGWKLQKWLELMVESGVQLPISPRPSFSIEGLGAASVASRVAGYARLGVGIRSPDSTRKR
jgi:hypothetical protein